MGVLELGRNDPEKAVGPLDRAAELAPRDPNILDYRGRAHQLVSRDSYRAMYEVDRNSWRVHRLQGEITKRGTATRWPQLLHQTAVASGWVSARSTESSSPTMTSSMS